MGPLNTSTYLANPSHECLEAGLAARQFSYWQELEQITLSEFDKLVPDAFQSQSLPHSDQLLEPPCSASSIFANGALETQHDVDSNNASTALEDDDHVILRYPNQTPPFAEIPGFHRDAAPLSSQLKWPSPLFQPRSLDQTLEPPRPYFSHFDQTSTKSRPSTCCTDSTNPEMNRHIRFPPPKFSREILFTEILVEGTRLAVPVEAAQPPSCPSRGNQQSTLSNTQFTRAVEFVELDVRGNAVQIPLNIPIDLYLMVGVDMLNSRTLTGSHPDGLFQPSLPSRSFPPEHPNGDESSAASTV